MQFIQRRIRAAIGGYLIPIVLIAASVPAFPSDVSAAAADWQDKGVSIVPRSAGDFAGDPFKQSVRNAQAMGANYVSLVIPYLQTDIHSSDIGPSDNTPSDETLASAIDFIHGLGMKVALKPHLEVRNGDWRGLIQADDRDAWYAKYGAMLDHLGDIGREHGVEEIVVGTELIGMASAYRDWNNTSRWESMIASLRSRYSGILTYSANWGSGYNYTNEFEYIDFWGSLDYIGISAYFEFPASDGSVESLKGEWKKIDDSQISPLQSKYGKPVIFTEIGYKSVDNAHVRPWDSGMGGNYNPDEQSNAIKALFQYWDGRPYFSGVLLWDWNSDPNYGGQGNIDYTVHNKPAEDIVRQWFTQGGSESQPPSGEWSASAQAPAAAQTGSNISIPVRVENSGQASDVIADIEIYDSSNARVFQRFFEHQAISNGQPKEYAIDWTPERPGPYTLRVGVFKNDWSTNYYWNDSLASISVADLGSNPPPDDPGPSSYVTDIWWPSDGASVSGTQPFKAMLEGKPTSEYEMYWQVDGGGLVKMDNDDTDYPHKEYSVDLSGWNWRGEGPYSINFVSKDPSGNTLSQKSVDIYVR